jgi:heme-degrading monooxygenase HmoA
MTVMSYLRFVLDEHADRAEFECDLASVKELGERQPGFRWAEVGRDPWDDRTYVVVSEWDEVDQVRAFEHHPEHEAVMKRWDPNYAEEFVHRRFVPWIRPETKGGAA